MFAAAVTSFVICFLIIPVIIKHTLKRNIVDLPGRRKIHKKVTPSMGGIAIFLGFLISSLIWIDFSLWKDVRIILIALVMTFLIGVRDDLIPIKPLIKILGQVMAASILILVYDLRLKSMYGVFGIEEIPLWLSYAITILTLVVITNSFNLVDGLDGLAGTIGSLAFLGFGVWFFYTDDVVFSILSFSMLGAIIAFLIFNWEPSKVFMGDTGAMVVGMLLAIACVRFIDYNHSLPNTNIYKFTASVSTALCVIIIPLFDTLRVFIIRIARKQSPFVPDKNHIHHGMMRLGLSHGATTLFLALTQILFMTLSLVFMDRDDQFLLPGIVLIPVLLSVILNRLLLNRVNGEDKIEINEDEA